MIMPRRRFLGRNNDKMAFKSTKHSTAVKYVSGNFGAPVEICKIFNHTFFGT